MDFVTKMHCLFAIKNLYTLTLLLRFRMVCNVGNVDVIALDKRKNRFFLKTNLSFLVLYFREVVHQMW